MPKDSGIRQSRFARLQSSTAARRLRAQRVQEKALEMTFRCERCEQKKLRCFVDTATGRCAGCISVHVECSLFVPEEEWEKVEKEKEEKRLELLRSEAETARSQAETSRLRMELAEVEGRERHAHDNCRVSKIETSASSIPKPLESIAVQHREALLSLSQPLSSW
ncbi:hypothetical protein EJ07DRAFT_142439 [Lizonia empirigonia]|nr:hypothetical protein EJ07DRAFT_149124 [Lizonia empirigonia]KAF1347420.1 hypothetical protein EJ07DRAFT_142439 [Lizonia empirigonia]